MPESDKKPRTLQDFQMEIAEVAQRIGLLQYQIEREIPAELEKQYNRMHDLDKEGKKWLKRAEAEQKSQDQAIDQPGEISSESTSPALSVVTNAST